jgi:hypothetical protein
MISAIENYRDMIIDDVQRGGSPDSMADFDFRCWAQDNGALIEADNYLADDTATCLCPKDEEPQEHPYPIYQDLTPRPDDFGDFSEPNDHAVELS